MQKRSVFNNRLLPYALIAPQIAITLVFFYWPASQALWQSFLLQDAFGLSTSFIWFENYRDLFAQPDYYNTMWNTLVFSTAVTVLSLSAALLLAVMADKPLRGAGVYRTLLIWPYAVAPAVAGVLWLFMFQPSLGVLARELRWLGVDWNPLLNGDHAMILVILAATWKQISYNFLFFLAGLQAIPKSIIEAAAIDGARPIRRFWTIVFPLLVADHLLPARGQHRLRLLRHLRHHRRHDRRRPVQGDGDAGLQGLSGRPAGRRSRRLGGAVGDPDVHRDRAHRDPVPLRRAPGELLMISTDLSFRVSGRRSRDPESIITDRGYGFRPSRFALDRNDEGKSARLI